MIDKIPEFLLNEFDKGKSFTGKFPIDIKQFMLEYATFYNWQLNNNLRKIFKLMKAGYSTFPECQLDGCTKPVKFINRENNLSICCSEAHSRKLYYLNNFGVENVSQLQETKNKKIQTTLKNFGVENPSQNNEIKEKKKFTCLKNYGVSNPAQHSGILTKIQIKSKETCLEKYGTEYFQQSKQGKKIIKNALIEKYGVDNIWNIPGVAEKRIVTNIENYGVSNVFELNNVKEKRKKSLLDKFGYEQTMHSPEIANKMLKSLYRKKEYIWKSGEISILQGYEPIVLKELEEAGYCYDNVLTDAKDMPIIWYEFENKKHRYYPDFYIPSENLIIEVKSDYILNKDFEKNQAKFQAVKDLGFNFKLEVR